MSNKCLTNAIANKLVYQFDIKYYPNLTIMDMKYDSTDLQKLILTLERKQQVTTLLKPTKIKYKHSRYKRNK